MIDRLHVRGLGVLDGEYEFSIVEMIAGNSAEGLTFRELRTIKQISDVRAGEIWDELGRGNSDLTIALATVILTRAGKRVEVDALLDAPATTELRFVIAERQQDEDGDEATPRIGPPVNVANGTSSSSGGDTSKKTSESSDGDPSPTGVLGLALSGRKTSET